MLMDCSPIKQGPTFQKDKPLASLMKKTLIIRTFKGCFTKKARTYPGVTRSRPRRLEGRDARRDSRGVARLRRLAVHNHECTMACHQMSQLFLLRLHTLLLEIPREVLNQSKYVPLV